MSNQNIPAPAMAIPIIRPLSAAELAPILGLHSNTLLRWAREGRIPHRRLGTRKIVFLPSEVDAWLLSGYTVSAVRAA
jgi:excisionase family DNA binding protein